MEYEVRKEAFKCDVSNFAYLFCFILTVIDIWSLSSPNILL